ncbi:hypothetical protein [Croceicoccus sp. YJ47]|uniref:hypothetical protein n=1 Tax=Croceicoccus sp. YJ47 TaxID=2798724 RepID=UPI0019213065|nr:hypothetical protein [Croceicoccus sp. YJ47]QQN74371.1 hypothetical protein JD971_00760 [Croceicoccus sp. YJ47]
MIWIAVILSCALAACTDYSAADAQKEAGAFATILEAPIYAPFERLGPEPYSPTLQDRRTILADRIEERNLPVLRRIKKGEMGNFGGIEWRWRDGPENDGLGSLTGVAYFLRAPDASLRRYTQDRLFVAAQGDFSRVDQETVAREWAERIGREIASEGFGNMSVPWLDISLSEARFEALRRESGWEIPANLLLRFSAYAVPDLPQLTEDVRSDIRYFAASDRIAGATPDIATFDAIVLRDGCFFIDEEGAADPLAMFGIGTGVYRDSEGHMAFRSRYSNYQPRLARVGTRMQLGYRSEMANPPAELIEACGQHRVVLVKSLDQAAGYGGDWFAVKQYAQEHDLSDAEAMKHANDCVAEQEQIIADRRLRASAAEPQLCAQVTLVMPRQPAPDGTGSQS